MIPANLERFGKESQMRERIGAVTLNGEPLTLIGNELREGDKAPDFEAVAPVETITHSVKKITLDSFTGKFVVVSAIPSLDTPVCDLQTHRFSEEAARLGSSVEVVTISMDLPYAQSRWLRETQTSHITLLSDHLDASFGKAYGILVKELRLLARAVMIIDTERVVRYIELLKDINTEPDYDNVFGALETIQREKIEWKEA